MTHPTRAHPTQATACSRKPRLRFAGSFAVLLILAMVSIHSAQAQLYWRTDGTSGQTWTSTSWSNPATTTGGTGWTSGNDAFFTANSSLTYVTGNLFGNVTISPNVTVTVTAAGTASATSHIYNIGTGATLTWTGQNFTADGTSFTKTGNGTWNIASIGNAYTGGFTLQSGTVIITGQNSLGAGNLTINGGTISSSGGINHAATAITIGGNFTLAGSGNDIFSAPVSLGAATRTITNNSTGNRTFSGVISGGNGAGLTFSGTGLTTLNATNTYTGTTSINSGTLIIGSDAALGSTGNITFGGGMLQYGSGVTADLSSRFQNSSGAILIDTNSQNITFSNAISSSNTGGLTKNGTGTLSLNASNTYTGTTTVNAGTLALGADQSLGAIAGSGSLSLGSANLTSTTATASTYSGVISGSGGLTFNGTGSTTLSGSNTYSGATLVNSGTLVVSHINALGSNASATTVANGATISIGTSGTTTESFYLNGAGAGGTIGALTSSFNGVYNISGNVTLNSNSTITSIYLGQLTISGAVNSAASTGTTILTLGGNSTYSANSLTGIISDGLSGAKLGLLKTGNGTWVIGNSVTNTFTGGITIESGTLRTNGTSGNALASNTILLGTANGGDATLEHGASVAWTGNTLIVKAGSGNRTLLASKNTAINGQIILEKDLFIINNTASQTSTINSELIGGGDLVLQTNNSGFGASLISSGNSRNLFTGNMTISSNAVLAFNNSVQNFSSSALNIQNSGTFNIGQDSIVAGVNGQASGTINATAAKTLTLAGNGNYTFLGSIRNGTTTAGTLVLRMNKEGVVGSQTLAGNNTYSGTTTIQAGTLTLDYSAANGSKLSDTSALALSGGSIVLAGGSHAEVVGNTTLSNGQNNISRSSGSASISLGNITSSGGALNFSGTGFATTNSTNVNGIIGSGRITVNGTDWAVNDGSNNIVALAAANYTTLTSSTDLTTQTYTNYLVNGTVLQTNNVNDYQVGTLKIAPTASGQSFTTNTTRNLTFGNGTINGGLLFTGNYNYSLLGDGNGTLFQNVSIHNYSTGNLTLGKFNNQLFFYGNGTSILAQDSPSNSGISVYGGKVVFSSNLKLGNATTGGNLTLWGGTLLADTSGGNISLTNTSGNRSISLGYNAPRIDVTGGNTLTIGGVISTSGGSSYFSPIVFGSNSTSGKIVLAGTNTFYGDLRLEGGTLSVASDAQLGDSYNMLVFGGNGTFQTTGSFTANRAVAINAGYTGTFAPDAGTTFTLIQPIRGAGSLTMNGAGTLILSGSNFYTGVTNVTQGILSLSSLNATAKSAGIQIASGGGLTYTGSADTLSQNLTVTTGTGYLRNSGGGVLTLNGSISKNGTVLRMSQGSFVVNGAITGSAANSDLYLESGGSITLNAANSYNGPTYLLNGTTLNANAAGALPTTTDLSMDSTGTGSSTMNLGANQSVGSLAGAASSSINTGSYALTTTSANSTAFAGVISGNGSLTKAGAGTLTLNGTNTYTGATTISAGTVTMGGSAGSVGAGNVSIASGAALVNNRSSDLTLGNSLSGAGNFSQTGSGNTTLSGTNTNTGAVRATSGAILFSGAGALSSGVSLLSVANATLSLADGTARTSNLGSASLVADNGTFVFDISSSAADMLTIGGAATLSGTRTINLNFLNTITSAQSWVLLNATGGGLTGNWTLGSTSGSGQSGFTFSLSATANALTLQAATSSNTFYWSGGLDAAWSTINGSNTNWASDSGGGSIRSTLPGASSDVIFAATGAGNLTTTLGSDRTIQSLTISQAEVQINGANTLTINSTSASGILVNAASGTVTLGTALAGSSAGLTKEGASLLVVSGNNSYGGGTVLSGGTLRVGSDTALGASNSSITISGGAALQASNDFTLGSNRSVFVSGNGSLDSQAYTLTVNSTLSGSGNLTKTGTGSLVLNNSANTLSGSVSLNQGQLVLGNSGALSTATLAMNGGNVSFSSSVAGNAFTLGGISSSSAGAGYDIALVNSANQAIALTVGSNNASTTYAGVLSGNGSLVKTGSGTLTLSGSSSYSGNTAVNAGSLVISGSLGGTGAISVNSGTLGLSNANALSNSTIITLANAAGASVAITANQTIGGLRGGGVSGGATTISTGNTLTVQETGVASYNGTLSGAGGFTMNGSGDLMLNGVVSLTGGVCVSAGNLTLAATNTYTGGTTLAGGVLNINNSSAISSGILTITGGTLGNTSGSNVTIGTNSQFWNGDFGYSSNSALNMGTGGVTMSNNRSIAVQSGNLTVAGNINGSGYGITKTGNGTLTLTGLNSFTGNVNVNAGTLVLSGGSAIADTVAITIADTAGAGLFVTTTESIGSLRGGGSNSTGVSIGSGVTLTISETGNNTYSGLLSGNGTLIKQSAGTMSLTNTSSTFSGQVQIFNGILATTAVGMSGATSPLGSNGTIIIGGSGASSGTLRWDGVSNETTNKNISTDTNTNYTTADYSKGPNLFASNAGATLTVAGNITSTRASFKTLTINGSGGSIVVTGTISDGSGPMKARITGTGNATHTLGNANNSFSGGVAIESVTANDSVTLQTASIGNSGSNSALGTNGTIQIGGNTTNSLSVLKYTGTGETTDKVLNLQGTLGNVALEQAGTGALKFTSNITVTGAGAKQFILQGSTAGTGEIAGVIVDSASGATSVTKNGTGTWILSGNNTYTGATTINAGVLNIQNAGALGSTAAGATVASGAALQLQGGISVGAKALTLSGNGVSSDGALRSISGNNSYAGAVTLNASTRINSDSGLLTLSGGISGAGQNLTVGGSGNTTISAAIATTTGGLTKDGAGTLTLSGNNTYTGTTTLSAGTLRLGAANILSDSSNLTVTGGTFDIGSFNETVNVVTMTNGTLLGTSGILTGSTYNITGGTVNALLGGGSIIVGNGTTYLSSIGSSTSLTANGSSAIATLTNNVTANMVSVLNGGSINGAFTVNASNGVTATGGTIASNLIGSGGVAMNGTGNTLTLTGANTYTGETTISAGTLSINSTAAISSTSGVTLADTAVFNYTGSAATLDRAFSVTGATGSTGTIQNSGSGLLTLSGGLSKNGTTLVLKGGGSGISVTGAITGSALNSDLTFDGGSITLAAVNTYNGPTALINGTTVTTTVVNALPTTTAVSLDATGSGSSTLALGANQSVASLTGAASSNVTLGANTLTVGTTAGNTTFAGRISGTGNLVKNGASTQVLSGNNSAFTGTTTINSGTLAANSAKALGGTTSIDINGGSLLVTADDALNANADINLNGGTLAFGDAGYNGYVGALTLSANSILDLGTSNNGVLIRFNSINWSNASALLSIYNWTGTTQWDGGTGDNKDQVYFTNSTLTTEQMQRISFYSGFGTGFSGNAFQITNGGLYNTEIIGVPEPSTLVTAMALLAFTSFWTWRSHRSRMRLRGARFSESTEI